MTEKSMIAGLAVAVFFLMAGAGAEELSAAEILEKCDVAEGYESAYFEMTQTITTTGGSERALGIRAWGIDSGDKQLSEYLSPADIKGQKILMTDDGDNIWMFNAETRRTRKLGSHMKKKKVMGSDFTYEDQAGGKLSEKYTGRLLGEEDEDGLPCFKLELKPTPEGPSYHKVVIWVGKADFVTRRVDFYEEGAAQPFKRMLSTDVKAVGEKRVPHTITMTNLEDRTSTVDRIGRVQFGVDLPASIFESRNMDR